MAPNSVRSVDVAQSTDIGTATARATSLTELISTIPQSWRSTLGAKLTQAYRIASKLSSVSNTLVQYERHQTEGSFPASISNSLREPKIQFSKEFLGTDVGRTATSTLQATLKDARKFFLVCAIERKKEEVSALQTLAKFDLEGWRKAVLDTAERVAATFGTTVTPVVKTSSSAMSDVTEYDLTKPPTWGTGVPKVLVEECKALWEYGSVFHFRAVALARSIADRSLVEKTQALSLKKEVDVKMRDADSELTTREVVRDELKEIRLQLTALTKAQGKGKKSTPKKGGSNPSRVKKGSSQKGKGKGKGRKK